jgi:protein SCO1/2
MGLAQMTGSPVAGYKREPGMAASTVPAALREIGFDQHIGRRLPLDTIVRTEDGRTGQLAGFFGARPVVLVFAYYSCPMLCTQVINGVASAVGVLQLEPGRDFEVVTISFDPHDTPATAAAKKAAFLERDKQPGAVAGAHFLTADPASIDRLTKAAGFRYVWDARTNQFAHPTGIIVVTPDGRLARYLFGIDYGPRDLRLALVEASAGRVGTAVDSLLLYCYHYDPMTGRYGLAIMRTLRLAGVATVLALGALIAVLIRSDRRRTSGTPGTSGVR